MDRFRPSSLTPPEIMPILESVCPRPWLTETPSMEESPIIRLKVFALCKQIGGLM